MLRQLCPFHPSFPAKRGDPHAVAGDRTREIHASVAGVENGPFHRWHDLQVRGHYKNVSEQAKRTSGCSLTFFADKDGAQIKSRGGFVKTEITMTNAIGDQPALWQDRVLLDEDFYRALSEHPVPVSESALRAIGPRSMVIDVYIWLAYRLHALKRDVEVGWPALFGQFGAGFGTIRRFRAAFLGMPCASGCCLPGGTGLDRRARHHPARAEPCRARGRPRAFGARAGAPVPARSQCHCPGGAAPPRTRALITASSIRGSTRDRGTEPEQSSPMGGREVPHYASKGGHRGLDRGPGGGRCSCPSRPGPGFTTPRRRRNVRLVVSGGCGWIAVTADALTKPGR